MNGLRRVIGSTPVRQAFGILALVSLVMLLTLLVAYVGLRKSMQDTMAANIEQHIAGFEVAGNASTLLTLVAAEARVVDPANRVLVYLAPDGRTSGNATARVSPDGVEILPISDDMLLSDDGYFSKAIQRLGGVLVVAESRQPLEQLRDTFFAIIMFSLGPTILITMGIGYAIATRTRARVEGIEATLAKLTEGDLTARIAEPRKREDDLKRIAVRVNKMAAAQEASVEALRQVSADIAHDLKGPLQRVSVMLHDLRDKMDDDDPRVSIVETAEDEAERAVAVFRSLLHIAQIEAGGPKAHFAQVDLGALLTKIGDLYLPTVEETGHSLTLSVDDTQIIQGDEALLGQMLANLLDNVLRHTEAGTDVSVILSDGPRLIVQDNGPGIPATERDQVIKRLYRLERSRTTPGNGLGLALVSAVAELHDAELHLEDATPGLRVVIDFNKGKKQVTRY